MIIVKNISEFNIIVDSLINNAIKNPYGKNIYIKLSNYIFDVQTINLKQQNKDFNINYEFDNCEIRRVEIRLNSELSNIVFDNCRLYDVEFYDCNINILKMLNCRTSGTKVSASTIKTFSINDSNIDKINITADSIFNEIFVRKSFIFSLNDYVRPCTINTSKFIVDRTLLSYVNAKFNEDTINRFTITDSTMSYSNIRIAKDTVYRLMETNDFSLMSTISSELSNAIVRNYEDSSLVISTMIVPTEGSAHRVISYLPNHSIYQIGCKPVHEDKVKSTIKLKYTNKDSVRQYLEIIRTLKKLSSNEFKKVNKDGKYNVSN